MDRLSIVLTLMTGAVLTGGLATAAFSVGGGLCPVVAAGLRHLAPDQA
mgnify:CR=1 FL=1